MRLRRNHRVRHLGTQNQQRVCGDERTRDRRRRDLCDAEGNPELHSERGHKTGNTSLPWSGELTEKEAGRVFVTHNVKVWIVEPLGTEMGGTRKGPGCILGGDEVPFEGREGTTEKQ
jgi:hypothetical protein